MKICIIDDNISITGMYSKLLKMEGHDIVVANGGREGLALLENEIFDSTVLDISMPEFSGIDIVDALNKSGRIANHKICVFTASSSTDAELQKLKDIGALQILKKPVDLPNLISTLEEISNSN